MTDVAATFNPAYRTPPADLRIRFHSLEHAAHEDAGKIRDWALGHGHSFAATRLDEGQVLPSLEDLDVLVIMGGAMNIYQYRDFPWLKAEREFIRAAIDADKAVFGVCLGAQLIADALGARVTQNPVKEIGWFPVRFRRDNPFSAGFPEECTVFHWHGDTFELPLGAEWLATNDACLHQGFALGEKVVGLQFHIELTPAVAARWTSGCESALRSETYVQTAAEICAAQPELSGADAGLNCILTLLTEAARASVQRACRNAG